MVRCPDGHESASEDYCDVCGMRVGGDPSVSSAPVAASAPVASSAPVAASAPGAGGGDSCPVCGTARSGAFCESCGYNFATAAPAQQTMEMESPPAAPGPAASPGPAAAPGPVTAPGPVLPPTAPYQVPTATVAWTAVVAADRAYYDKVEAEAGPDGSGIAFPGYCPERRFELTGAEMRIGRRSPSRGLNPEIDLTGPPTDPGISRLHAVLIATPDGWAVLDPGSANGTTLNGNDVPTGEQVPLHDGDQITVGAWTKITVHAP